MIKPLIAVFAFMIVWALFVYVAQSYTDSVLAPLVNIALFNLALAMLYWAGFELGDLVAAVTRRRRPADEE